MPTKTKPEPTQEAPELRPEQMAFKARMLQTITDSFFRLMAKHLPVEIVMSPGWIPEKLPHPLLREGEVGIVFTADGAFWVHVDRMDDRRRPVMKFIQSGVPGLNDINPFEE